MTLDDPASLQAQTLTRQSRAAAVVSGVVAPLVLGVIEFVIAREVEEYERRRSLSIGMEFVFLLLMVVPAAWLGARATRSGITAGTNVALFANATASGFVFLLLSALVHALLLYGFTLGVALAVMSMMCGVILLGVPLGFAFGALLRVGLGLRMNAFHSPTQETPARSSISAALMLLIAARIAWPLAMYLTHWLRQAVGEFDPEALPLILTTPLLLWALVLLASGSRHLVALHRTRAAILSGTHPEYHPGDIAPEEDAIPLTEADRKSAVKRTLVRRASSAYRSDSSAMNVYVGLESTTPS